MPTATDKSTPYDFQPFLAGARHLIAQIVSRKPNVETLLEQLSKGDRLIRLVFDEDAESVMVGTIDPAKPEARAEVLEVIIVNGKDAGSSLAAAIDRTFGRPN